MWDACGRRTARRILGSAAHASSFPHWGARLCCDRCVPDRAVALPRPQVSVPLPRCPTPHPSTSQRSHRHSRRPSTRHSLSPGSGVRRSLPRYSPHHRSRTASPARRCSATTAPAVQALALVPPRNSPLLALSSRRLPPEPSPIAPTSRPRCDRRSAYSHSPVSMPSAVERHATRSVAAHISDCPTPYHTRAA
jgi:hypothetical protein